MLPQEPLFSFTGERIRRACRPRDAHTIRHLQRQSDGRFQADSVALRYINRPHCLACPHYRPDPLSLRLFIHQWHPTARRFPQFPMRTDQQAFRATDRRPVQQHSQMAGQPKPPRVRVSLPIAKQQIGQFPELSSKPLATPESRGNSATPECTETATGPRRSPARSLPSPETGKPPRSLSRGSPRATRSSGCGRRFNACEPVSTNDASSPATVRISGMRSAPSHSFRSSSWIARARSGVTFHSCRLPASVDLYSMPIIV